MQLCHTVQMRTQTCRAAAISPCGPSPRPRPDPPPAPAAPALHLPGRGAVFIRRRDDHLAIGPERLIHPLRALILLGAVALAGCSTQLSSSEDRLAERQRQVERDFDISDESFFDLFRNRGNPEQGVVVNRYLWQASLDTLSFLPLETADPFSGLILTGWGNVNGGAYRVTVYISEPALDARSLRVAAFRQGGGRPVPVGDAENRALENAILTRARQMRIAAAEY